MLRSHSSTDYVPCRITSLRMYLNISHLPMILSSSIIIHRHPLIRQPVPYIILPAPSHDTSMSSKVGLSDSSSLIECSNHSHVSTTHTPDCSHTSTPPPPHAPSLSAPFMGCDKRRYRIMTDNHIFVIVNVMLVLLTHQVFRESLLLFMRIHRPMMRQDHSQELFRAMPRSIEAFHQTQTLWDSTSP